MLGITPSSDPRRPHTHFLLFHLSVKLYLSQPALVSDRADKLLSAGHANVETGFLSTGFAESTGLSQRLLLDAWKLQHIIGAKHSLPQNSTIYSKAPPLAT